MGSKTVDFRTLCLEQDPRLYTTPIEVYDFGGRKFYESQKKVYPKIDLFPAESLYPSETLYPSEAD